jgi:hypothetical protein
MPDELQEELDVVRWCEAEAMCALSKSRTRGSERQPASSGRGCDWGGLELVQGCKF